MIHYDIIYYDLIKNHDFFTLTLRDDGFDYKFFTIICL